MHMSLRTQQATQARTIYGISAQTFWVLLAIEGVILAVVLAWVLSILGPQTPAASAGSALPTVRAAISDRLAGVVNDPLIDVVSGTSARASNVRGLSLDGVTYYYYVEGSQNFDPYSRGLIAEERIERLMRDESGPAPIVIYTVHP
jgi:ABC-type siderophore export system fused ATPase/permease subunit